MTLASAMVGLCGHVLNAQDSTGADEEIVVLDPFVVTGVGAAINREQIIKREAPVVVDAVSFEDLGNFSDESLADALQRIPGVQIERDDSGIEGDRVSIRGIGPEFVTTSVNGRTPMSAGGEGIRNFRQFNLNTIPTEIVGGANVYKTSMASLIEPGLAGGVDIQTLKPLDIKKGVYENLYATVTVGAIYPDTVDKWSPRYSGLLSYKNDDKTFGFYIAGMMSDEDQARDEVFLRTLNGNLNVDNDGDGVTDETLMGLRLPNTITFNPIREERERQGLSGAMQWKPSETFEINIDFFSSKFHNASQRSFFRPQFNVGNALYGPNVVWDASKITVTNDTLVAFEPGAVLNPGSRGVRAWIQNLRFDNDTDNLVYGANIKWGDAENLLLTVDLSASKMHFEQDLKQGVSLRTDLAPGLDQSVISYDATGEAPVFTFGDDVNDATINYRNLGLVIRDIDTDGKNQAIRADLQKKFSQRLTAKIGLRWSNSEIDSRVAQLNQALTAEQQAALLANVSGDLIDPFLSGVLPAGAFNQWLSLDYDESLIPEILVDLTARDDGVFGGDLRDAVDDDLPLNRGDSFVVEEETFSYYGQLDFEAGSVFGKRLTGNVGVRAVRTENTGIGFTQVTIVDPEPSTDLDDGTDDIPDQLSAFVPTETNSANWEYLPSLNLNLEVAERQNLRFGVSKVMSRPAFVDLAPRNSIRFENPLAPSLDPAVSLSGDNPTGNSGNPSVAPYTGISYDLTYEFYTKNGGAFYISAFFKDVTDYILTQSVSDAVVGAPDDLVLDGVDVAALFDQPIDTTQPINFSDGDVKGFEIGMNQPLSFLPIEGFGVQANYTYVDSNFDEDLGDAGLGWPGSSQDNFNMVLYYENQKFSARLAYSYRNDYLRALGVAGSDRQAESIFTEGSGDLSLNLSYRFTPDLTIRFGATNLTGENLRNYIQTQDTWRDYIQRPKTYSLSLRYSFGK